jgi:RNA polymerase sigma-B factor
MSRQLRMQVRAGDESPRPEESAIVADAVGGEPDVATASARLDDVSDDDLLALYRGHARGSREQTAACEVLVSRCMPLVRACVRPYRASLESAEDLMQVGYLGLMKALHHYDPAFERGLRAYAAPCITGEIKRHFRDKRWQIRVTRPVQELLLEQRGAMEDLTHELGRSPLESEVAGRLGVTPEELREARQAGQGFSAQSLNAPVGYDEGSAELGDLLGTEDTAVEHNVNMEAVERHWHELPRREQQILLLRFYGNRTQEQVAAQLGVSQMHVSRLQARALARLRDRLLGPDGSAVGTAEQGSGGDA